MPFKKPPIRFWIAVMVFLTTYVNYTMRSNFSVSIIAMVQKHRIRDIPECNRNSTYPLKDVTQAPGMPTTTEHYVLAKDKFDWSQDVQGLLLGAYFYGYVVSCVPGGFIAEWIGPFNTILWAHVLTGVFNSMVHFITYMSKRWGWIFLLRFLVGLMGGVIYPALHCLISRWAPPDEKGKFVGALMGNTLGTCLAWPIVGLVTELWGWGWGFHVLSIQCAVYCVIFWIVTTDSPDKHRWVTEEELNYINVTQGGHITTEKKIPPYKLMFLSIPFWALTICHFGNLWGLYLFLTGVPKYISEVLGFNLKSSGVLAALPFILRMFSGFIFGAIGDFLQQKNFGTVTIHRKFFILFSHLIPAVCLASLMLVGCNWKVAVTILVISLTMNGAVVMTNLQNAQDLAPNFAGTIFGIISLIGGFTGFITPSVTAFFIRHNNGIVEWRWNFLTGAAVYSFCGIVFILFGSGAKQPWNDKVLEEEAN